MTDSNATYTSHILLQSPLGAATVGIHVALRPLDIALKIYFWHKAYYADKF
jgi:hypothetical protein